MVLIWDRLVRQRQEEKREEFLRAQEAVTTARILHKEKVKELREQAEEYRRQAEAARPSVDAARKKLPRSKRGVTPVGSFAARDVYEEALGVQQEALRRETNCRSEAEIIELSLLRGLPEVSEVPAAKTIVLSKSEKIAIAKEVIKVKKWWLIWAATAVGAISAVGAYMNYFDVFSKLGF